MLHAGRSPVWPPCRSQISRLCIQISPSPRRVSASAAFPKGMSANLFRNWIGTSLCPLTSTVAGGEVVSPSGYC